jgi:hypothetical protein
MFVISRRANRTRGHTNSILGERFATMSRFWFFTFVAVVLGGSAFLMPAVSRPDEPDDAKKRIKDLEKNLAAKEAEVRRLKEEKIEREKADVAADSSDSAAIMDYLRLKISTEGLQEPVKLKVALEFFSDKLGGKLPVVIDSQAFASVNGADATNPYEEDVFLPPVPKTITLGTALNLVLSQVGKGQATYLIRHGQIEVVPASHATAKHLLTQRLVVSFARLPLRSVLAEFSEISGLAINIDPAIGEKAATPIRATLRNTSLEDALVIVTEMADLKFVVLRHSIYVTTASKVKLLEEEERQRDKRREEINKAPQNQRKKMEAESE